MSIAVVKIIRDGALINYWIDREKKLYKFKKKHNVNHYSIYSVMIASVVKRFNRIFKNEMWTTR